jgi:hypothetical protein
MTSFAIIEVDDGFEVVEVLKGQSPEDAALAEGGRLIDPGPFHKYEDANDAIDKLEAADERE